MNPLARPFPADEHNRKLLSNVQPAGWINPTPAKRYNLVVIGGGTAGLVSAAAAAILGARVALVERHLMGGDCLNTGCVPSKALIRSARAAADARGAGRFGVLLRDEPGANFPKVMERLRRIRATISAHDSFQRFADLGIDLFSGNARFAGPDVVDVDGVPLRFRRAVIASGARPIVPPIEGLADAGYLTNETVFNLTALPARLMVVGGGPLGVELSQAFARLGSQVTLVEMLPQFLPREDPDAAAILAGALERDGVEVRLGTRLEAVRSDTGGKRAVLDIGGSREERVVDEILIGVGRAPNVESLNLEAAGVAYDRSGVTVTDTLRTTNRRIYAAGDVCLQHKFTHTADAAARIVIQNALFPGPKKKYSSLTIPWCTYSDPEVAHVGLYEVDAGERGIAVDTFTMPFDDLDRAIADGEEEGFVRVHVKRGSDRLLGATIVGRHAGEVINELSLAMVAGIGLGRISDVIHSYPTQAEAIRKVADQYRRSKLTPLFRKLLTRWFAWSR